MALRFALPVLSCLGCQEPPADLVFGGARGECDQICGTLGGYKNREIRLTTTDVDELVTVSTDSTFCLGETLPAGNHTVTAFHKDKLIAEVALTILPFGAEFGLDKPSTHLDEPSWVPSPTGMEDGPILVPGPQGSWDSRALMMPTKVDFNGEQLLFFAGTDDEVYHIGFARRVDDDHAWTKFHDNPIISADKLNGQEWDFFAQNTPEALVVGEELWLYYNGRSDEDRGLSIGLATSDDMVSFEHLDTPVLTPSGIPGSFDENGVAHPSVVVRDGIFEMWFASGTLQIGYAISEDGLNFTRYCNNPVLKGTIDSWEQGSVKAPEVVWDGEMYWMTYSGCGKGCFQVGWASSADGLHWARAEHPILVPQPDPAWNSLAISGADVDRVGDEWRFYYAGTHEERGQIGYATATP
ncbi:MAG: hypothetical protein HN348_24915 [Proteobacteria bacterium]|nr:hypothetical protein [Pseudomonadota bacterium]